MLTLSTVNLKRFHKYFGHSNASKIAPRKNGQIFPMNNDLIVVLSFLRELSLLFDQAILKFFATLFYLNDQRVKIALKYLNL